MHGCRSHYDSYECKDTKIRVKTTRPGVIKLAPERDFVDFYIAFTVFNRPNCRSVCW